MKKILIILLSCITLQAQAQKIRITDTSNKWNFSNHLISPSDPYVNNIYVCSYIGDTIVNGLFYLKTQYGLIREDTAAKIVYTLNTDISYLTKDSTEQVLYNYNLIAGDTVLVDLDSNNKDTSYFIVDYIDSVLVNGNNYAVWHLYVRIFQQGGSGTFNSYNYIEGIGCTKGLYFPLIHYEFENLWTLNCFENNGSRPIISKKIDYFNNTTSCTVSIRDLDKQKNASVFPNPIDKQSKIMLPYRIGKGAIIICNTIGQVVASRQSENFDEVNIGDINIPGIYFYLIKDNISGTNLTGKFICK